MEEISAHVSLLAFQPPLRQLPKGQNGTGATDKGLRKIFELPKAVLGLSKPSVSPAIATNDSEPRKEDILEDCGAPSAEVLSTKNGTVPYIITRTHLRVIYEDRPMKAESFTKMMEDLVNEDVCCHFRLHPSTPVFVSLP